MDLSLIPRPVISLFQRLKQRKGPIPNSPSAGMDWSRVETKLSSTLMQFQRDGVEYVHVYIPLVLRDPIVNIFLCVLSLPPTPPPHAHYIAVVLNESKVIP